MIAFKTSVSRLLALILVGLSAISNYAAEQPKRPVATGELRDPAPTKIKPVDINSGSIEQLRALPGINEFYAQNIINGRPYRKKDELVARQIIPKKTFDKIKDRIITVTAQ